MEELKENELEKITGGHGDAMKALCPFCNNNTTCIYRSGSCMPIEGSSIGKCSAGHKAKYIGGFYMTVEWTDSDTNEVRTSNFKSA